MFNEPQTDLQSHSPGDSAAAFYPVRPGGRKIGGVRSSALLTSFTFVYIISAHIIPLELVSL